MLEKPDAADTANWQEISVLDVLNFLNKYKKIILGVTFLAGVLAAIFAMQLPNVYTARLKLLSTAQGALIQPLLESESFAEILVRRFDLVRAYGVQNINEARDQLLSLAHVKLNNDTTITVEVEDVDPKRAAALANAYSEEMDRFFVSMGMSEVVKQQKRIGFRIRNSQEKLDAVNKKLNEASKMMRVDALSIEKTKAENIASLRAQLDFVLDGDANLTNNMVPILDKLREQLDRMSQVRSPNAIKNMSSADLDYLELFSQAKYLETTMDSLKKRQALLEFEEQMNATRVLDSASVPERKSKPKRMLIVTTTMLTAAFVTILLMLLKEWFATIRRQEKQAASAL